MEIITNIEQGSEEWFRVRSGMPTASKFATVMAKGAKGAESKTRDEYMRKLVGEIITGEPAESYTNAAMERGHEMEGEARALYAYLRGVEPYQVAFIKNGPKGCSPDALIGDVGMAEIKSKAPHILISCYLRDDVPPEHKAQVQGSLWVAEREWLDFVAFYRGMPPFIYRVSRDETYISELAAEVDRFNDELTRMVEWVRSYGVRQAAA